MGGTSRDPLRSAAPSGPFSPVRSGRLQAALPRQVTAQTQTEDLPSAGTGEDLAWNAAFHAADSSSWSRPGTASRSREDVNPRIRPSSATQIRNSSAMQIRPSAATHTRPSTAATQDHWMERLKAESARLLEPRSNSVVALLLFIDGLHDAISCCWKWGTCDSDSDISSERQNFVVGYTGHVPRVRQTYAVNSKTASRVIYEKAHNLGNMARVTEVQGGRRTLVTTPAAQLPGTGSYATSGYGKIRKDAFQDLDCYSQGYKVHLQSYYESCAARGYKDILIKAGFAGKNRSNIDHGDPFYYSGRQMYETSNREAFRSVEQEEPEDNDSEAVKAEKRNETLRRYALIKAVVGSERIEEIVSSLKEKIHARVSGGVRVPDTIPPAFPYQGAPRTWQP